MGSASQILANRYGAFLKQDKTGRLVTMCWSEQNGGGFVECQLSVDAIPILEAAKAEFLRKPLVG